MTEDLCRCGHPASTHTDGEGPCAACAADHRSAWAELMRCHQFRWNYTWQPAGTTA